MSKTNNQVTVQFVEQLLTAGWKQKISYLNDLSQRLKLKDMALCPQLLESMWLELLQDNNVNVLQKTVATLRTWVDAYGIRNLRLKRELVKTLVALAKMGKADVDSDVIAILTTLEAR